MQVVLILALLASAGPTTPCESLRDTIQSAPEGAHIVLPAETCELRRTIQVPSGVTISGVPGSRIDVDFGHLTSTLPLFSVDGSERVTFSDFEIRLGANARGFRADNSVVDAVFERLVITGNSLGEATSSMAFYLKNARGIRVDDLTIETTWGGIYVVDAEDVEITGNHLSGVNYGNIVVSGRDILIVDNTVLEPGKANANQHASGDGITIGGGSIGVRVIGNRFWQGYCYLVQVYGPSSRITVADNLFLRGTTSAVYVRDEVQIDIIGNTFLYNAHGVALVGAVDSSVIDNVFVDDTLYLGRTSGGVYTGNVFLEGGGIEGKPGDDEVIRD